MNQRQWASVLFAAVGVFLAVSRLPDLMVHVALLVGGIDASPVTGEAAAPGYLVPISLGAVLLAVLLGLGLVFFRDALAVRLFPVGGSPLRAHESQAVALSVVGCYFVISGLSDLAWIGRVRQVNWSAVTELALGVGLFLGARGLARLWATVQSRPASPESTDRAV